MTFCVGLFFTQHNICKVHPCCSIYHCLIMFHHKDILKFYLYIHQLMDIWLFPLFDCYEWTLLFTFVCKFFVWTYVLISLGCIPTSGIARWHAGSIFNNLRTCQNVFQIDYTISHSLHKGEYHFSTTTSTLVIVFFILANLVIAHCFELTSWFWFTLAPFSPFPLWNQPACKNHLLRNVLDHAET